MTQPIEIIFASNAGEEAPQVDRLADAVTKAVNAAVRAEATSKKLEQQLARESTAYRQTTQAVKEYATANENAARSDRSGYASGNISPQENPRLKAMQNESQALTRAAQARRRVWDTIATSNREGWKQVVDAAEKPQRGVIGAAGEAFGIGKGATAVAAGVIAIAAAWSVASQSVDRYKQDLTEVISKQQMIAKTTREAGYQVGAQGMQAASSHGAALRKVIGAGAMGQATATGETDGAEGIASSFKIRDGDQRKIAIEAAKMLRKLGENSFSGAMEEMAGNGGIFKTAQETAAFQMSRSGRQRVSAADVTERLGRIDADQTGKNLEGIYNNDVTRERAGVASITSGAALGESGRQLAQSLSPVTSALLEIGRVDAERLAQLRAVADNMGFWATAIDKIAHPYDNAGNAWKREARNQADAAFGASH